MNFAAQLALAGVVGLVAWQILSWVLFPILGLAVGLVGPVIKIAIVVGLGWLVLRFFRGSRTSIA
jgi:hypothetical protein